MGGVTLIGGPLFLSATGMIDLPTRLKPENLIPLSEWLGKKNAKLPSEGCDQSATTTPCAKLNTLQAQGVTQAKPDVQQPQGSDPNAPENGPLVNTYKNEARGFSFKYPDGFKVVEGDYDGQVRLIQPGATKGFGMIIDFYGSTPRPSFVVDRKPASLADFQKSETRLPAVGYGPEASYMKEITKNNTVTVLRNGVKVLSQIAESRLYDGSDKDITYVQCGECGPRKRLVLFNGPQNYITILPFMTDEMEKRIIQSIEYK